MGIFTILDVFYCVCSTRVLNRASLWQIFPRDQVIRDYNSPSKYPNVKYLFSVAQQVTAPDPPTSPDAPGHAAAPAAPHRSRRPGDVHEPPDVTPRPTAAAAEGSAAAAPATAAATAATTTATAATDDGPEAATATDAGSGAHDRVKYDTGHAGSDGSRKACKHHEPKGSQYLHTLLKRTLLWTLLNLRSLDLTMRFVEEVL